MRAIRIPALASVIWCLAQPSSGAAAGQPIGAYSDHRALIAALESLIATGQPRHTTHDEGERLQLAVNEAIVRRDREIERLAMRADSPIVASVARPISSIDNLPGIALDTSSVLKLPHPVPYTARVRASIDGGEFVLAAGELRSATGGNGPIDKVLGPAAAIPGWHVVHLIADMTFRSETSGGPSWTEQRVLPPVVYALYDPLAASSAAIRALVYGPASTTVHQFDPQLGDEPLSRWLNGVLENRQPARATEPQWMLPTHHRHLHRSVFSIAQRRLDSSGSAPLTSGRRKTASNGRLSRRRVSRGSFSSRARRASRYRRCRRCSIRTGDHDP